MIDLLLRIDGADAQDMVPFMDTSAHCDCTRRGGPRSTVHEPDRVKKGPLTLKDSHYIHGRMEIASYVELLLGTSDPCEL